MKFYSLSTVLYKNKGELEAAFVLDYYNKNLHIETDVFMESLIKDVPDEKRLYP